MGLIVGARRRHHLLADLGGRRPRRPPGQPDRARGAVRDQARRHHRTGHQAPRSPGKPEKVSGRTLWFRRVPAARARGARRRLFDPVALPDRARALDERLPDRLRTPTSLLCSTPRSTGSRARRSKATACVLTLNPWALSSVALKLARQPLWRRRRARALDGEVCSWMASSPTYDPNLVEGNFDRVTGVARRLQATGRAPQPRDRTASTRPARPSRSITASAAIDSGRFKPDSSFVDPGYCEVYGKRVNNYDTSFAVRPSRPPHGPEALGQLGLLQHRQGARREEAGRVHQSGSASTPPAARDAVERAGSERALQGDEAVRPEGGHGRRSRPVRLRTGAAARDTAADGDGRRDDREQRRRDEAVRGRTHRRVRMASVVVRTRPQELGRAVKPETAQAVGAMMKEARSRAAPALPPGISGVTVAGKTGTAETGIAGLNTTWFIGYARPQPARGRNRSRRRGAELDRRRNRRTGCP